MGGVITLFRRVELGDRWRRDIDWWSLIAAAAVTVVIGLLLPWEPGRVDVTVNNPTNHRLYIHASTPDDDNLTLVGIVSERSTRTMPHVIDRGDDWVLHLRTLGAPAGIVTVTRADLVNGTVEIPLSINDDLAAAGVPIDVDPPSPGRESTNSTVQE